MDDMHDGLLLAAAALAALVLVAAIKTLPEKVDGQPVPGERPHWNVAPSGVRGGR